MTYRLDVVPVGANDEGGIVVPAVLRARPRRPVVLSTGFQRRAMEGVDLPAGTAIVVTGVKGTILVVERAA